MGLEGIWLGIGHLSFLASNRNRNTTSWEDISSPRRSLNLAPLMALFYEAAAWLNFFHMEMENGEW